MTSLEECQPFKSLWQICSWEQHVLCLKHTKPVPGLHQYIKWIIKYDCTITMTHLFNSIRMWRVHMRDSFGKVASYCRNRSDMPVAWTSWEMLMGKLTSTSQRPAEDSSGDGTCCRDLHLVNGSAAQKAGRVLETAYFPEKLPKEHLSWDCLPAAPAGRFHTLCCWKTFYTLLPSVMSWLVYPSNSDVKVLQYFRTWPSVVRGQCRRNQVRSWQNQAGSSPIWLVSF